MGRWKGSMTLEAAFVVPLYLFVILSLYSTIDMMRLQGEFQTVLMKAGKEVALYAAGADLLEGLSEQGDTLENVLGICYAQNVFFSEFSQEELTRRGVKNGAAGVSFWRSGFFAEEDVVDLVLTYELDPMCNFAGFSGFPMANRCRLRAWTGYRITEESGEEEQMVYVTEYGTVYHLTRSCSHLSLSITPVLYENLSSCQNNDGADYRFCDSCPGEIGRTVYITDYGECYHSSLTCGGLRRTIYCIPISEAGDKGACSRCGG